MNKFLKALQEEKLKQLGKVIQKEEKPKPKTKRKTKRNVQN
jgi:hypothetical protein